MTKTKRQLRAEAVERLNEVRYGGDAVEFCEALLGERWSGENLRERIADLLTDEELPEGDAIGLLRDFPRTHTVGYVPVGACKDRKMRDIEDLYIIADMVERDYVRRDAVEDVIRGRDYTIRNAKEYIESLQDAVAAKPLEGEAEKWERRYYECNESYGELARERDTLKANNEELHRLAGEQSDMIDELTAERDYWKGQVQLCLDAAYPPSHSPERRYAPGVMGYPDRDGCTTPSTLVSAVIDELRDERAEQYMGILKEALELERERDELKRQLDAMRDERDEALEIRDKALGDAATFKAERDCWRRQEN